MNGDHGAGLRIGGQLTDDIAHLLVVEHRHADDVGCRDIGHAVGKRRAFIGPNELRVTCEETFPSSSPAEIAHILELRTKFPRHDQHGAGRVHLSRQ